MIIPSLNLTINEEFPVQFLDLNISINNLNIFEFDLFIKKTNTFSYLNVKSNHPPHVFKGIIISLILRIRRICSNNNQFNYHCNILYNRLLKKGYDSKLIRSVIKSYSQTDRNSLLNYKINENNISSNILFISKFDKKLNSSTQFLNDIWKNVLPENSFLKNFLFKCVYNNYSNFNNYLVQNFSIPFRSYFYKKCKIWNCKICCYANTSFNLKNKHNIPIIIPNSSSCNSKFANYILCCLKCDKFYIGQTSQTVYKRIYQHLNNMKNLIKLKDTDQSQFNEYLNKFK